MSSAAPPRVLLADSDQEIRVRYAAGFHRAGCDVVEASDGRDALAKALVRHPSLVVTDLHLPLMDGLALCEILRRDHVTADVPIVVVAAGLRPIDAARARRAGADVVLGKPTSVEMLMMESRRLLRRSQT